MPIDIDQLRSLIKFAAAVGPDKGSQAMSAAAQAAKPAGGIPLPKPVEDESASGDALDQEKAQREQEKLEQQKRKELESKENEIRGLRHELDLERVERAKRDNELALDKQMRQEHDKLKSEIEKFEQDKLQFAQEKARQESLFKAEEIRHQAELDKATYKQEADIAKQQAKATSDLAKQQAQSLIATNDKARQSADKYYADARAKLVKDSPAISPALQNQLDAAIASLGRFKNVHKKQVAIPKPGTPPIIAKEASVKWAATSRDPEKLNEQAQKEIAKRQNEKVENILYNELGVASGGAAYGTQRAAARARNTADAYASDGNKAQADLYYDVANRAEGVAAENYKHSQDTGRAGDVALYKGYMAPRGRINGWWSHKDWHTSESQYDRDRMAFKDLKAQKDYGNKAWYTKAIPAVADTFLSPLYGIYNTSTDALASHRNAERFGANRFWNTTFDDPSIAGDYHRSLREMSYSDSVSGDVAKVLANTGIAGLDAFLYAATKGGWGLAKPLLAKAVRWAAPAALGTLSGFVGEQQLGPSGEFNYMSKQANVLPVPGAPPQLVKKAAPGTHAAQTSNDGFDVHNINNPYFSNPYGKWAKPVGSLISSFTGGWINPYLTIGKYDAFLAPTTPISGTRLAQNVVHDAEHEYGSSGVHNVVMNAARKKHMPGVTGAYNGAAPAQSVSGRVAADQLSSILA